MRKDASDWRCKSDGWIVSTSQSSFPRFFDLATPIESDHEAAVIAKLKPRRKNKESLFVIILF